MSHLALLPGGSTGVREAPSATTAASPRPGLHGLWLTSLLDEIDYGVLLIDSQRTLLHVNRAARARLTSGGALVAKNGALRCGFPDDEDPFAAAVGAAARSGLRRMLTLGRADSTTEVAVVPLPGEESLAPVLLLLSRSHMCEPLSAHWFARCHRLTSAESRVLQALCDGLKPCEVANAFGVALCTVRSQIAMIRAKTGASSVHELVHRVAQLPPVVNAVGLT